LTICSSNQYRGPVRSRGQSGVNVGGALSSRFAACPLGRFVDGGYFRPARSGAQWHESALFFMHCGIGTVKRGLLLGLGFCVVRPRISHEIDASNFAWSLRAKTARECVSCFKSCVRSYRECIYLRAGGFNAGSQVANGCLEPRFCVSAAYTVVFLEALLRNTVKCEHEWKCKLPSLDGVAA
jgi:hypothetical protein